ncbi:MAG: thiol reductase thioredoxin [Ectothiorhodospiraceae bacterium]|nr:thiol reductase thioredoxin [Ectothiorhodospiraceae bacterium]
MYLVRVFVMMSLFVLTGPAFVLASGTKYSAESFETAQGADKLILVDVKADWCPTCKAQGVILEELQQDPAMKDLVFISVDFDTDKDFLKAHNISKQSTILVFDGKNEIDRSIAITDRDNLREFVLNAVEKASSPDNN